MSDVLVYTPTVVAPVAFPSQDQTTDTTATQTTTGSVTQQAMTPNQAFPAPKVATDLISAKLNTKTQKILASFQFAPSGAIQIGQFQEGVSGDIRISPEGIVMRDIEGNTTIGMSAEDGSGVFAGEIQAGSFVSGEVVVGDGSIVIDGDATQINVFDENGNNTVRLDDSGLIGFDTSGDEIMHLKTSALELYGDTGDIFKLLDAADGTVFGKFGYFTGSTFTHGLTLYSRGSIDVQSFDPSTDFVTWNARLLLGYNSPNFNDVFLGSLHGDVNISAGGNINLTPSGSFKVNGSTKTAIVETSDGYKALYCAESPEVWFFDFTNDIENLDHLFLEATEGEMKTIKTQEGDLLVFRRRKGFQYERFAPRTARQYLRNNQFWSLPL